MRIIHIRYRYPRYTSEVMESCLRKHLTFEEDRRPKFKLTFPRNHAVMNHSPSKYGWIGLLAGQDVPPNLLNFCVLMTHFFLLPARSTLSLLRVTRAGILLDGTEVRQSLTDEEE